MIKKIKKKEEIVFYNKITPHLKSELNQLPIKFADIIDASNRLDRFSNYFMEAFPDTKKDNGIIESKLTKIDKFKNKYNLKNYVYVKEDCNLPISGSIKARGGIYEVLKIAETIAIDNGFKKDDYRLLNTKKYNNIFNKYNIIVGSTGNLGLSIGLMSAKLGFKVSVHMSRDAKAWKKDKLRNVGVKVVEYQSDFSYAVSMARKESENKENSFFIDDERSKELFLGYSVAALRLKTQLDKINFDYKNNNFNVYLPCGVGGGPAGIAFGLKCIFGSNARAYFCEPTNTPSFLLGLYTKKHHKISVNDIGLDTNTVADGLAVGRASKLAGNMMENILDGCYTKSDDEMINMLKEIYNLEKIKIEPSAAISLYGPIIYDNDLKDGIHISWLTGGSMLPDEEFKKFL